MSEVVTVARDDFTDLAMNRWAILCLVNLAAGSSNEETKTRFKDEIADVANQLAGATPNPVERMLADTAAICWFALRTHEVQYANRIMKGTTLIQADHDQREIERTHRRYMVTLKTLATVRRLAIPAAVQVNVANQQVNQVNPVSSSAVLDRMNGAIPLPAMANGVGGLVNGVGGRNGVSH